jgi:predicted transposase/invertase (TIGR01784 family)
MSQHSSGSDAFSAAATPVNTSATASGGSDTAAATAPLLDPRNDYVFKRIFASHIDLLNDLVNVVRGDAAPLTLTKVLNPNILPEDITGKEIILDILAVDNQGRTVDVEVQVSGRQHYPARVLYYAARAFVDQLAEDEDYNKLRSVIGVHILDFSLFKEAEDIDRAQWRFGMLTHHEPRRALDTQLELNFLELPKLKNRQGLEKTNKPLYDWSVFFSDVNNGAAMQRVSHPEAKEAFEILKSVSATAQERLEAERRIRYVREVNAIKDYHWDEGKQAGIKIGRAEGKAEATRALVGRLLERKFGPLSPECQSKLDAATLEQLEHYAEVSMTASSLQEVLAP